MVQTSPQFSSQTTGSRPSSAGSTGVRPSTSAGARPNTTTGVRPVSAGVRPTQPPRKRDEGRADHQAMVYINDKIKAFEVIVITEDGENLGKMKRFDALALAQEQGMDLVQMSYNPVDKVSTAKITDFGKYMYEKKKTTKEKKKSVNK